ncbi:hypothetical protein LTR36_010190 [Oleoguttula mirabilis]|uniref:2-dehydropantoate 2-reductase n=1 Tax=Oleoguttula mirabilis TaxID=1507867 RepID=A0AAV9JS83_9PEZI|nr:hypothetical protein LTR36_010190 [Oleoguttula mirabilis]
MGESELIQSVCVVGGNAVSAFLSWRLSATNACDVTLVWKSGFESVSQYGISFRSSKFGNERFKPRHVVRTPEEAAGHSRASFDYVLLCVKALPDVYDLASVIESVVSPQHTCILVNTTHTLGIESYLEQRFPTNVVLSLVSGAEISQIGASEFEHRGDSGGMLWVGAANRNSAIPATIQTDMAEALAMTLKSGQVDCEVSTNIRQQQYERMIGPIAFHPASVIFETPSHADLLEKVGARSLITGVIDELMNLAKVGHGCSFKPGFREDIMEQMVVAADAHSTMYQDFTARRPMEVETYLGSPIKLAQEAGVQVPRIETLYALLHNVNVVNQQRPQQPAPGSPAAHQGPPSRLSSAPGPKGAMYGPGPNGPMNGGPRNGVRQGSRAPSAAGGPPPPMRRGPPSMSGYPPPRGVNGNGYGPRGPPPQQMPRRPSFEGAGDLEEFSHVMLYDNMPDGGANGMDGEGAYDGAMTPNVSSGNLALREREVAIRQKEMALREREYSMGRRRGPSGPPPPPVARGGYDDDDDEDGEDFFDPMAGAANVPQADVENFDMMSVTSRRTRKAPSAGQLRANPEMTSGGGARQSRGGMGWGKRQPMKQNRASTTIMSQMPGLHEELMNNPLVGYSSDRYGNVDRMNMGHESRTNSLTAERLGELQHNGAPGGPFPPISRRGSQSPGNPLSTGQRPPQHTQRVSPPNGYAPHPQSQRISPPNGYASHAQANGVQYGPNGPKGRPSPPGLRQPAPQRNNVAVPKQIEQTTSGVSTLKPQPNSQVRSLTGSASASAGSGESNRSAALGDSSELSGNSSSSSLGPRAPAVGVR